MKRFMTVRIPTFWTAEKAASIHRFVQSIQLSIWCSYQDEIEESNRKKHQERLKLEAQNGEGEIFDDDIPF
jgi:hypothetical protein